MTSITTVTQKGQVTLPVAMRKMFAIKPYDQVLIKIAKGQITIQPVKDVLDMAGSIPPNPKINALQARGYMEKHYSRA